MTDPTLTDHGPAEDDLESQDAAFEPTEADDIDLTASYMRQQGAGWDR